MITALIVCTVILGVLIVACAFFLWVTISRGCNTIAQFVADDSVQQARRHEHTQSMLQKANLAARKQLPEVWEPDVMPNIESLNYTPPERNPYIPTSLQYTPTPSTPVPPTHAMHRPNAADRPADRPAEKPISGAEERERVQREQLNGAAFAEPRRIG